MLAIEIDGITHNDKPEYDLQRQQYLENAGIHFLRFDDIYVKENIRGVLRVIEEYINDYENTHP